MPRLRPFGGARPAPPTPSAVSESKSHNDFVPAAIGFFGGLVVLFVFAFAISRMTTAKFADHGAPAGQQAH